MEVSEGFPAVARADARVLILGSLPGRRSLSEQAYYAHPRNAFWPIMEAIFGIRGSYAVRCAGLTEHRIALWDVLQASVRPGSLDADIRLDTARTNDFERFLAEYSEVEKILFNGQRAAQLFRRSVPAAASARLRLAALPSTSPAFAAMPFSDKLKAWQHELPKLRLDE